MASGATKKENTAMCKSDVRVYLGCPECKNSDDLMLVVPAQQYGWAEFSRVGESGEVETDCGTLDTDVDLTREEFVVCHGSECNGWEGPASELVAVEEHAADGTVRNLVEVTA